MQDIFDPVALRRSKVRVRRVRRWIRALKSGRFKQGTDALFTPGKNKKSDKFCCMGVMLALEAPKGWIDESVAREEGFNVSHKLALVMGSDMPSQEACQMFGLNSTNFWGDGGSGLLAYWNDHQVSFIRIAERLDKALKKALWG